MQGHSWHAPGCTYLLTICCSLYDVLQSDIYEYCLAFCLVRRGAMALKYGVSLKECISAGTRGGFQKGSASTTSRAQVTQQRVCSCPSCTILPENLLADVAGAFPLQHLQFWPLAYSERVVLHSRPAQMKSFRGCRALSSDAPMPLH